MNAVLRDRPSVYEGADPSSIRQTLIAVGFITAMASKLGAELARGEQHSAARTAGYMLRWAYELESELGEHGARFYLRPLMHSAMAAGRDASRAADLASENERLCVLAAALGDELRVLGSAVIETSDAAAALFLPAEARS